MADHQVRQMFEATAASYDLQNRLLSAWRDRHWRKIFARHLRLRPGSVVGDMAVGTADIAIAVCERYADARVVGVDFTPGMLRVARRKIRERHLQDRIELRTGDLRRLEIEDERFDALTMSFGIRNIAEREQVLRECCRVLRSGGLVQIMEMALPEGKIVGPLYRWYFDHLMPLIGNWLSRTDYAYDYLKHSVYDFPSDRQFVREMGDSGFEEIEVIPISFGTAKIYRGRKPGAS